VKLTITFPDNVAKKIRRLPNRDEFVSQAVEKALEQDAAPVETLGKSRWARLVDEIADGSMSLGDEAARFEQDRKELRLQSGQRLSVEGLAASAGEGVDDAADALRPRMDLMSQPPGPVALGEGIPGNLAQIALGDQCIQALRVSPLIAMILGDDVS